MLSLYLVLCYNVKGDYYEKKQRTTIQRDFT